MPKLKADWKRVWDKHSWLNFDVPCVLHCILTVALLCLVREQLKELTKQYDKSENDLKALQSVGQVNLWTIYYNGIDNNLGFAIQIVGEVLKQLTEEKCK